MASSDVMDVRVLPRDFVRKFIEMYKSFPCLWKVRHTDYNNRTVRDRAYKKIAEFCKEKGFPDANRDFVVRKIQSLRGSFRKELRKFKTRGYRSQLWYFDLLKFTVDQEEGEDCLTRKDKDDCYFEQGDDLENDNENEHSNNSNSNSAFMLNNDGDDDGNGDGDDDYEPDNDIIEAEIEEETPSEEQERPKKKRRRLSSTTKHTRHQTITEFEAVGVNVARKLERMHPTQALYAESIINNVLKRGILKKLKEIDTCDGACRFFGNISVSDANPLDVEELSMKREK